MIRLMAMIVVMAGGLASALAADPEPTMDQAVEEAAIRKAVEAYVSAFNRGDAKALAALWSPEAVYINPVSGEQVVGREQIEKQFSNIFTDSKNVKLQSKTDAIQFVSPNVAVEHGTATVTRPEQATVESEYSAVYVKRDGQWLLDRVTEEDVPVVKSNYQKLKELEWMIGSWVDQDGQNSVETTCAWTKNQNFMTRSFMVTEHGRVGVAGMQIVGWDPSEKRIRSWVFDSDGGFAEGIWTKKDKSWYIQSTGTAPEGSKSSSTNIITYVDDNTFTWQSINRYADGEVLPNVDEVVIVRQTAAE